ncbi:unnamed protein product [Owenia fusiformis]|uniref:Complex III assembly factor LYRM7 n=1 Tax=Owenia fusiformis TaxID=6347 RepID=A0A8J1TRN6_OWEFU|nr:unnamed protein product [Owenia fusiformis]
MHVMARTKRSRSKNMSRSKVCRIFKELHRTRQHVFSGDLEAQTKGRLKINEEFKKNKDETDPEKIEKLIKTANGANDYLKKMIVQAVKVKDDTYEVKLTKETVLQKNAELKISAEDIARARKAKSSKQS